MSPVATRVSSPSFVGRVEPLARLRAAARPQGVGAVVVGGEAGVGKTRLVRQIADEVAQPVADEGAGCVLSGTCIDLGEGGPPFGPMVEILRTLVREDGATAVRVYAGPAAGELGRLVSELATPEPAGVPEPVIGAIDPAGGATRLFEVFLGLFERLARDRPVLVLVEDLHWADRSTRDLLTYLIHRLGPARRHRHDVPQ
jgi:predicted ATPase